MSASFRTATAPSLTIFLKAQVLYGAFRRDVQEGHYELAICENGHAPTLAFFPRRAAHGRSPRRPIPIFAPWSVTFVCFVSLLPYPARSVSDSFYRASWRFPRYQRKSQWPQFFRRNQRVVERTGDPFRLGSAGGKRVIRHGLRCHPPETAGARIWCDLRGRDCDLLVCSKRPDCSALAGSHLRETRARNDAILMRLQPMAEAFAVDRAALSGDGRERLAEVGADEFRRAVAHAGFDGLLDDLRDRHALAADHGAPLADQGREVVEARVRLSHFDHRRDRIGRSDPDEGKKNRSATMVALMVHGLTWVFVMCC